jgi:uncharacterized membrane protein
VFAHPIHPAVVHFPFGLLFTSTIVDLGYLAGLWPETHFAAWLMASGLVAAVVAVAAGIFDFRRLTEAQVPYAMRHMGAMAVAVVGYGVALYLRRESLTAPAEASGVSVGIAIASALVLAVGGYLGGELVYRYGAGGIDTKASPDG